MKKVLICGAGKIGALTACLLLETSDYEVHVVDVDLSGSDVTRVSQRYFTLHTANINIQDTGLVSQYIKTHQIQVVISCLPYYCNVGVAELAKKHQLYYFDLTEDVSVTRAVNELAAGEKTAFVPQCGLAPGFISIAANALIEKFDKVDTVKMRVGALPENISNSLHYAMTWSTDGLINEYGNPCYAIVKRQEAILQPLEGLETIQLDGRFYEAFNTSGGLGSLAQTFSGRVNTMNYKTIRYPGHCEKMKFLMHTLKLNDDRETLKKILDKAIPKTYQDIVLVYVSVLGLQQGELLEEHYVFKVYPKLIAGLRWSAIQISTAAGICAVMDEVFAQPENYQGLVRVEQFALDKFLQNRFGCYYSQNVSKA